MSAAERYFVYWSTLGIEKPYSKDFATPELFKAALAKFTTTDAPAAKPATKVYKSPLSNFALKEETDLKWEALESNISQLAAADLCRGNVDIGYLLTEGIETNTILMLVSDSSTAAAAPLKRTYLSQYREKYKKFHGRFPTKKIVDADAAIIASQAPQQNLNGVGFILARERPLDSKKGLYLDVVCSSATAAGIGGPMLKFFEDYARSRRMAHMELSALPSVIGLYINPRFGYEYKHKCSDDAGIPISPALDAYIKDKTGTKPKPTNNEESYAIPEYLNFMIALHKAGFNKKAAYDEDCESPDISPADFVTNDCGADGFKMVKCLTYAGGKRRTRRRNKNRK